MLVFEEEKVSSADVDVRTVQSTPKADFSVCKKRLSQIEDYFLKLEQLSDNSDAINLSNRLLSAINHFYADTKSSLARYLFATYREPPAVLKCPVTATVDYFDKIVYISFNMLPAKRSKNLYDRNHSNSIFFADALDSSYSWYRQINGIIPRYKERVVVWYVIHHKKDANICDYDNYDFKLITDMIATLFLKDDAPRFISQYFDDYEDDNDYLEVRILPRTQF